jgi:hypothetical protein
MIYVMIVLGFLEDEFIGIGLGDGNLVEDSLAFLLIFLFFSDIIQLIKEVRA